MRIIILCFLLAFCSTVFAQQVGKDSKIKSYKLRDIEKFLKEKPQNQWVIFDKKKLYIHSWSSDVYAVVDYNGITHRLIFHGRTFSEAKYRVLYSLRLMPANSFYSQKHLNNTTKALCKRAFSFTPNRRGYSELLDFLW